MKLAVHEGFKFPWVKPVSVRIRPAAPQSFLTRRMTLNFDKDKEVQNRVYVLQGGKSNAVNNLLIFFD